MTLAERFAPQPQDPALAGIIKLAVMAVGGQGGGVLTNWIEALARMNGHVAQATSVAGVAQRTGATIYYVEMAPAGARMPVFSLAPAPGDVDVLIAAEMMEAGRAIMRGFVTPDRTTLIASTHRAFAVSEKVVPGDGIASSEEVEAAAQIAALRLVMFDMDRMAIENGSVISASLFGALAGSGALPFPRETFEAAIRAGGKGVEASLRAFAAAADATKADLRQDGRADDVEPVAPRSGFDAAAPGLLGSAPGDEPPPPVQPRTGPDAALREWSALSDRVDALPAPVRGMTHAGLRKVVEFQDCAYGRQYLDLLDRVRAADDKAHDWELTATAAKYLANAMAYDDLIRVADLKTRPERFARIDTEMSRRENQSLHLTEFMHPRAEEIVGLMPARLGGRAEASPRAMRLIDRLFNRGRRLRSDGIIAYTALHWLGGLRGWRLRTLRHAQEVAHRDRWLDTALAHAARDYALGVEILKTRRLVKGYSDTHARGVGKFAQVMDAITLVAGRDDAAEWARRLREAALRDEKGKALEGAIQTIRSFI